MSHEDRRSGNEAQQPSKYPPSTITGSALERAHRVWHSYWKDLNKASITANAVASNSNLVDRLLDACVPEVMQANVLLEDECHQLNASLLECIATRLHEMRALARLTTITVSRIDNIEHADYVNQLCDPYGIFIEFDEQELDSIEFSEPLWLVIMELPGSEPSVILAKHDEYATHLADCSEIVIVPLDDTSLARAAREREHAIDTSAEAPEDASTEDQKAVDDLLRELNMG